MNSSEFSDWDLYRFAIWTGLRTLPVSAGEGLKRRWVQAAGEYVFFQREYDHDSLRRRLLEVADMEALDVSFFGEAKVPVEQVILNRRLPKAVRWGLFPAHFPLSRMFLRPLTQDQPSKKKVEALTLRKRRGPARSALEDAPCAASSAS